MVTPIQTDSGGISSKNLPKKPMNSFEAAIASALKSRIQTGMDREAGLPPGYSAFLERMRTSRDADLAAGKEFADQHFGAGNPEMKAILDARKKAAFGGDTAETDLLRARGVQGINSQLATGMRSLRGLQGASGLRGGAALGQVLPTLSQANIARGNLESDLAVNALRRRDSALNSYESSLTGERAGALGAQFGYAGLGAQERTNALQYGLGREYIGAAERAAALAAGYTPEEIPRVDDQYTAGWKKGGYLASGNPYVIAYEKAVSQADKDNVQKYVDKVRGGIKL